MAAATAKQSRQSEGDTRLLSELRPNPLNPRTVADDDEGIAELAESIRAVGLLQSIVITPANLIIAGHRRAVAAKRAGLTRVSVSVRDMNEAEQLAAMLAENVQRRALNPVETGRACKGLADRGLSPDEIAAQVGLGRQKVLNHLAVVELSSVLQDKIAAYQMPVGMAPHLMRLPSELRLMIGVKAVNEGWTVPRLAEKVTAMLAPPSTPATARSGSGVRTAPPANVSRPPAAASAPPASVPAPDGNHVVNTLNTLSTTLRRSPQLVRQPLVREALERLSTAVREALR